MNSQMNSQREVICEKSYQWAKDAQDKPHYSVVDGVEYKFTNNKSASSFDGHFWVEDEHTGEVIYDGGLSKYKHKLGQIQGTRTCVFQPIPDEKFEDKFIGRQMEKQMESWSRNCYGDEVDKMRLWLKIARQNYHDHKDAADEVAFSCFQMSVGYWAVNGGRIRFGCSGYHCKKSDVITWIFGHPENENKDWINITDVDGLKNTRPTLFKDNKFLVERNEKKRLRIQESLAQVKKIADEEALKRQKIAEVELEAMLVAEENQKVKCDKSKKKKLIKKNSK